MLRYLVDPIFQVINTAGKPATGGYIEVYLHGTRDKYYCASDFEGTLHPFKIPLDSLGSNIILADDANTYDVYVYNRYGSLLMSRYNVSVSSSGGGGSEAIRKGTIHKLGLWTVDESDPSPKPSEYWVLDLESPNDSAPGGYDRLTVERAREIHNTGSFFGLRTIHVQNPYDDNLLLETNYEFIAMSQTFELKLAYIDNLNRLSEYTIGNFGEYVGVYSVNDVTFVQEGSDVLKQNKIHRYSFGDGTVDGETPTYGSWLIDLDKPDPNGPEGYARVTPAEFWQSTAVNGEVPVYLQDKNANNSLTYAYLSRTDVTKSGSTVTSVFAYFVRSGYGNDLASSVGFRFTKYPGSDYLQKAAATEDHFTALSQTSGDGSDVTATFTEAQTRANIGSGEKLSILFGKVKKWFTDLKALAFKDKADLTQDVSGILPIANGGTNASTASDARTNLDVYSKSEVDNALPQATSSTPSMDGMASVGSETRWAKGDHVHPTDTSREATANKTTTVRQNGQADNTKFPTEAAVRTAIDSAVSSAYHAAGTKTVAQLTSSLLVSANEGDVYNITDSGSTTADFVEGAGHPITAGDNVGICDVGGGVYKFDLLSGFVDLTDYLTKTGDGSDVTASFTAASARTNVTTGEKLSVLFGKIAKWFSDLKSLAFKDKVNTADIENDAVTADNVKDNETLPVNITGYANHLRQAKCKFIGSETGYRLMAHLPPSISNYADTCYIFNIYETRDQAVLTSGILKGVLSIRIRRDNELYRYSSAYKGCSTDYIGINLRVDPDTHGVKLYAAKPDQQMYAFTVFELLTCYDQYNTSLNPTLYVDSELQGSISGTAITPTFTLLKGSGGTIPLADNSGVGSASEPVYVSNTGEVLQCTPSDMSVGSASYATVAGTGVSLPNAYGGFDIQTGYRLLATMTATGAWNDRICTFNVFETRAGMSEPYGQIGTLTVQIRNNNGTFGYGATYSGVDIHNLELVVRSNSDNSVSIYVYSSGNIHGGIQLTLASSSGYTGNPTGREGLTLYLNSSLQSTVTGNQVTVYKTVLWDSIKSKIYSNTVNVNQTDSNTETSSFTFVNGHIYHLTVHLQGSPLVTNSTSSGTGYVAAYIGSSLVQSHYSCRQFVDIQQGELTAKDIKLPVNWKAENITGSSDNQIHVVVVFNNTAYGFLTTSPYQLILQGTDFDGA